MNAIRVAIAGVGNCASSLVQGVYYYNTLDEIATVRSGMTSYQIGCYKISDIKFVAAFDIDHNKIGRDLAEAIFIQPNCARQFSEVPTLDVEVQKAPLLDGLSRNLSSLIVADDSTEEVSVSQVLKQKKAHILINFLPAGAKKATEYYAEQCLIAKCALINATSESIASNTYWVRKFTDAEIPLAGDDVKSQIGATILHRSLIELLLRRGIKIDETYQSNTGGNTDFYNLCEDARFESKQLSKKIAINSMVPYDLLVSVPKPDYIPQLLDHKTCCVSIRGRYFASTPFSITALLEVEDSPNSAGVMVDLIRLVKIALDSGLSGALKELSAFYFKRPPRNLNDTEAYNLIQEFIRRFGHGQY
jgi:myo-inositol-1-phosphate synthase